MSTRYKWDLLNRMKGMIEGYVGTWAKEARDHIDYMETLMLDDTAFANALKEWDEKLLPQCPGSLWVGMRKGQVPAATL